MSDQDRVEFLRNLYGKKNDGSKNVSGGTNQPQNPIQNALGIPTTDPNAGKTPEEIAKLHALRNQLHSDYYQNLVNPPKPKEEPVTEKLEKEKQMEALELEQKEKEKPDPLQNVKTGTGEKGISIGVSG